MSSHRDPRMMEHYVTELRRASKAREKAEHKRGEQPSDASLTAALNAALAAEELLWMEAMRCGLDLNALDAELKALRG